MPKRQQRVIGRPILKKAAGAGAELAIIYPAPSKEFPMFRTIVAAAAATLAFALPLSAQSAAQTAAASGAVDYERDVRPILAANCFGCHGPRQAQSGLRLDLRQNAMRGSDYGVVIVPGKSTESKLIKRLIGSEAGLQMPPTGP